MPRTGIEVSNRLGLSQAALPVGIPGLKWSRMELNHRFPGCGPGVFAARPRDHIRCSFKWSHRESHPDLQRAMLASSCWTMTPICSQRKPWDSNPQTAKPSPVFKTGSSSGRMASVKFRGLESNQRTPGSGPGVTTNSNCPGSLYCRDTARRLQVRGEGVEPPSSGSRPESLPLADPRSRSRVPCGS